MKPQIPTNQNSNEYGPEQLREIFIPLATGELIWDYVDRVLRYCADHRISETIKLSRAVKALHASYDAELAKFLDRAHLDVLDLTCRAFKEQFSYDLTVMFCTIANELNYKYAGEGVSHEDLRVNALGSIMLLRALRTIPDVAALPKMRNLDEIMEAYVAPYELDISRNVEICQKVLAKRLAGLADMEVTV